jgi:hypothetical protein
VLIRDFGQMKLTMGESPKHLCLVTRITSPDTLVDVSGQLGATSSSGR